MGKSKTDEGKTLEAMEGLLEETRQIREEMRQILEEMRRYAPKVHGKLEDVLVSEVLGEVVAVVVSGVEYEVRLGSPLALKRNNGTFRRRPVLLFVDSRGRAYRMEDQ